MKKIKCTRRCLLLSMVLMLSSTAFISVASASDKAVTVENVTLHTYVGADGQEVQSITYQLGDISALGSIAPGDFNITIGSERYQ